MLPPKHSYSPGKTAHFSGLKHLNAIVVDLALVFTSEMYRMCVPKIVCFKMFFSCRVYRVPSIKDEFPVDDFSALWFPGRL